MIIGFSPPAAILYGPEMLLEVAVASVDQCCTSKALPVSFQPSLTTFIHRTHVRVALLYMTFGLK